MKQLKNQMGRTMVEMLAVLAIIGVLTVGAIAGLGQAIEKYRVGRTHDDILSIDSAIVDLYSWQRKYPDSLNMSTMCKNNVFPMGCVNDVTAKNIFGGEYEVTTTGGVQVNIRLTNVPGNICRDLLSDDMDWGEYLIPDEDNPACEADGSFVIKFY